ncbi:MAG TPA: AlpA family transcriptional regulator [Gammaproteobacteria bacterium]|nr:AlpA family transcriptional regulator [Gammaproteobacteria bacterium]
MAINLDDVMRIGSVLDRFGITRTTLYRWIKLRGFPAGRHLAGSPNSKAFWLKPEVEEWLDENLL